MDICYICQKETVEKLLDLGLQPISNRFLLKPTKNESTYPLAMGYCQTCCLIQLINPVPSEEVTPQFDWIKYNEPEGHLDKVAELIDQLPGITKSSSFCGISGKEGSLLGRLNKKGYANTWELSLKDDLNIVNEKAGIETIQRVLNPETSHKIISKKSPPKVIIARHILEHAHHPLQFMQALKELSDHDGYIIFEVPDCTKIFDTCEYSAIWEEHTLYFTPCTFLKCLESNGFIIHSFDIFPYVLENCMVAIVKTKDKKGMNSINLESFTASAEKEYNNVMHFAKQFNQKRNWYQNILTQYRTQGPISLLGAGHLACHFINLMEVKHLFDFIVDDHPSKKGLFFPGSQLPIYPSFQLEEKNIKLCLLSLNQESETKVINQKQKFIAQGGKFLSIFSTSQYAIQ